MKSINHKVRKGCNEFILNTPKRGGNHHTFSEFKPPLGVQIAIGMGVKKPGEERGLGNKAEKSTF